MSPASPQTAMPPLGAHLSIAGGYYKAVDAAARLDMNAVQVFTKNNNQWRAKPMTEDDAERFRRAVVESGVSHTISHSSYLINLASPDPELWQKSVDAFIIELQRADFLGIPYVVLHPGASIDGDESKGLARVIRALDKIHTETEAENVSAICLLETTAGQGTCLGHRFEHLATILEGVKSPERLGVCLDTCHVFAAGYPLATEKDYRATMREFNRLIGVKQIKAFHLNDSKRELGSRVDRHERIGQGHLGLEPFRFLLNDRRFRRTPMVLETPKGEEGGQLLDAINLQTLRNLVESSK